MIIYLFTFPNGKHYVGRTNRPFEERLREHKHHTGRYKHPLYHALAKYGWENVKKEVIDEAFTQEELILKELDYIYKYDSLYNGYNLTLNTEIGGDNWVGRKDTPEYDRYIDMMSKIASGEKNGMWGKKHKGDSIFKMKEKSVRRYSLEWFIERYGEEQGNLKYKERNLNKSEKSKGSLNPAYKSIDLESFKSDVLAGTLKETLLSKYGLASSSFSNKLFECFGDKSLYRIKDKYGLPKRPDVHKGWK